MKVLLFGGSGQIGRLVHAAFKDHEVRALSRKDADIRDRDGVNRAVESFRPDTVILAAGMGNADTCEDHPSKAYAVNCDGARNVAEASRDRGLVHFSTDHVFDGKAGPYGEEDATGPLSTYGRTKLESERICFAVHPACLVVRTSIVWSHDPGGRNFFVKLLGAETPMDCWTDHVGSYTYGPNFAAAVRELVESGRTGVWNLVGPGVLNRHEFALKVARRFGRDPELYRPVSIRDTAPRAARPLKAGLRVDKARGALSTILLSADEALELAYADHERP